MSKNSLQNPIFSRTSVKDTISLKEWFEMLRPGEFLIRESRSFGCLSVTFNDPNTTYPKDYNCLGSESNERFGYSSAKRSWLPNTDPFVDDLSAYGEEEKQEFMKKNSSMVLCEYQIAQYIQGKFTGLSQMVRPEQISRPESRYKVAAAYQQAYSIAPPPDFDSKANVFECGSAYSIAPSPDFDSKANVFEYGSVYSPEAIKGSPKGNVKSNEPKTAPKKIAKKEFASQVKKEKDYCIVS